MAIHYAFQAEGDTLLVKATGFDEDLQDVMRYGVAIIQECVRGNFRRVLCDERELEYRIGTLDIYEAATFIVEAAPGVGRVAIVSAVQFTEEAQFWENVTVNRGFLARAFSDIESARLWVAAD